MSASKKTAVAEKPKGADELELESLLFGDSIGFRSKLDTAATALERYGDADGFNEAAGVGGELAGLDDDALFFIDEGAAEGTDAHEQSEPAAGSSWVMPVDYATADQSTKSAWMDSDDERISVSLASEPRLRKLRVREGEDVVSGTEYIRRLRWQFERLHPRPAWAEHRVSNKKLKKRSRREQPLGDTTIMSESEGGESDSGSGSDSDGPDDAKAPSSKALSRLLQASTLLRNATTHKRRRFMPEVLDIQRMKCLFADGGENPGAITKVNFHPTLPIMLSSGPAGIVYLHHINGHPHTPKPHPMLISMQLQGVPVTTSAFLPSVGEDGSTVSDDQDQGRVVLSGRRRFFHVWNISTGDITRVTRLQGHQHEQRSMEHAAASPCGRYLAFRGSAQRGGSGVVNIVDGSTFQWHSQVRIDSIHGVRDFAWWADGSGLTVLGANGEVTEWHVERGCAVGRWRDDGAVGASVIRLGGFTRRNTGNNKRTKSSLSTDRLGGDRWVAIGSNTGIVNIYDRWTWIDGSVKMSGLSTTEDGQMDVDSDVDMAVIPGVDIPMLPKPVRTIDNLVTPITHLAFSPPDDSGGQLLALASHSKQGAFRIVHLPTATVYRNWPTSNTPLGRVSAISFGFVRADGDVNAVKEGSMSLVLAVANDRGKINMWEIR